MICDRPVRGAKYIMTKKQILKVVLFLIPALVYVPTFLGSTAIPFGKGAFSDLLITHYPNILYLRNSILINLEIPFWSGMIHSGTPFAANPLAGLFYLPGWFAMIFPLPAGLSIVVAAHAVFGTWGMYGFLGQKGIGETGRVLGAMIFGLMPKLGAHFGAGHITLLYAIAWTPWFLYCSGKDKQGWKTGTAAGMLFLADPRWAIYAGFLWVTYDIAHRHPGLGRRAFYYLRASVIALFISAPLLIPLLEFVQLATRAKLSVRDMLTGSMPFSNLVGLIIPGSGGNTEWYFYTGGVVLAVFVYQMFKKELVKRNLFWLIWAAISLILAMGTWGIPADWLSRIPFLNLLRIPARSLFITGMCFSVIAGISIDYIIRNKSHNPKTGKVCFGIISLGLMMAAGAIFLTQAEHIFILWGFLFFALGGILILAMNNNPEKQYLEWLVAGVIIIDLLGAGLSAYELEKKANQEQIESLSEVIQDESYFRTYSPSYSVEQYLAAEYGLELADGVDPLHIASYADFMGDATGVHKAEYSVTIPPFETGNPSRDNQGATPNTYLLGMLNVKYVISEFDLNAPGLIPLSIENKSMVYQNEYFLPRAWVEKSGSNQEQLQVNQLGQARVVSKTANSILVEAAGPGELVVSEIQYPGWRVYVNGKRMALNTSHQILRSVSLPEGNHEILFKFYPASVYIGLSLAGLGWIILAYQLVRTRIEKLST